MFILDAAGHCSDGRPDISDGRVSLVIFFYPDADNLERQWQTINEDEEEKSSADVVAGYQLISVSTRHSKKQILQRLSVGIGQIRQIQCIKSIQKCSTPRSKSQNGPKIAGLQRGCTCSSLSGTTKVQLLSGGMDKGFKASLLWGESKDETSK